MTPFNTKRLAEILGKDNVFTDADTLQTYGQDWTGFHLPDPLAVVFPRQVEQVAALVLCARQHRLALVPSGGRTGLSAGAVAAGQEVVVSFDQLNHIKAFNETDRTLVVEAGVVTAAVQAFALEHSLYYPVDFASSGSSQIGGNIATNAGGIKVLRYGMTRDWVAGLKVVAGTGEIFEFNRGLVKNATGYDLRHLFVGSEGTLGFIVEATIRLTVPPPNLVAVLLALPDMAATIEVLTAFRRQVTLSAFEFFSDLALDHVIRHAASARPMQRPFAEQSACYVLLEFEQETDRHLRAAEAAFAACVAAGWVTDGLLSQSEQQRQDFWQYRERISESITRFTPYKNDVSVVPSAVPAFLASVNQVIAGHYPDFQIVWFGHIGDGNLHLNILKPDAWSVEDFKRECERVSDEVLAVVQQYAGSISAEHGVGLLKKDQLHFTRPDSEIALMKSLKSVFDPDGVMNPGKLV